METKRILHIGKYYYPFVGGVEKVERDYVNSISRYNHDQVVICFHHDSKKDSIEEIDGIKIIRCGCQVKISSQSISKTYAKNLKTVLRDFKPNVVIFHYPNPFAGRYLRKYLNTNTSLWIYWHYDITKQKILKLFFEKQSRWLADRANKIIVTSPNIIQGSRYLPDISNKCFIIPACINEDRLNQSINEDTYNQIRKIRDKYRDKIICFAVGRHVPYKGFEYLIKASELLDDRFAIIIAGEGELTENLHRVAESNKRIHFVGKIDDSSLIAYFKACDIYCFPSITKNEAFGLSLAEAMYFNKPAVTFTIEGSGVNYVSINNETGLECENGNVQEYANCLNQLANDKELRERLGKNGHKRVDMMFTYRVFQENIVKLFLE